MLPQPPKQSLKPEVKFYPELQEDAEEVTQCEHF